MTDTTAKIRSKGCESTGLTEQIASRSGAHLGSHLMAVVELRAEARTDDAEGKHVVHYVITQIEPAVNERAEDHLRELSRTLHAQRRDPEGQPGLPGTDGFGAQSQDDILRQGESLLADEGALSPDPEGVPLKCGFPGCGLPEGHDGDHDVFLAPVPDPDEADDDRDTATV